MINFILCDDIKEWNDTIYDVLKKYCEKNNINYKIHRFYDYDSNLLEVTNSQLENKFYILDVVSKTNDGVSIAKAIRKNDTDSIIVFISDFFQEYQKQILKGRFIYLDFINKKDNYKKEIIECIDDFIENKDLKRVLILKKDKIKYIMDLNLLTYICYNNRKLYINYYTIEHTFNISLKDVFNLLDRRFIYCHKACIVNLSLILKIDKVNKIIYFKNGSKTNVVSLAKLKEIESFFVK